MRKSELGSAACSCSTASVTVVVPCHNEEQTIGAVVTGARRQLPHARILVGDNASTDATSTVARDAGAEVVPVPHLGKGRAVRRLLERCATDVVVVVDGDATYDLSVLPQLVHGVVCNGYDLINVSRIAGNQDELDTRPYRRGHEAGNRLLTGLQRWLTGVELRDILSGYKAMSRRFVTSLPVRSKGFQLEVEIASHAVALDWAYDEIEADYLGRPPGSTSKLSTVRDGASILRMILRLYRDLHPFAAFATLAIPWFAASFALVARPLTDYVETGLVPRFPSLIAGVATFIVAMLLLTSGWLLERTRSLRRDLLLVAASESERVADAARHTSEG